MSRKYIPQRDSLDFVYPNNFTAEYDLEIIHDINDNCVSGVTTVFSATTLSSTGITFNIQGSWSLNGAEPYINGGLLSAVSIHLLGPSQSYYRPFRLVDNITSTGTTLSSLSFNKNFTVLPSELGLTGFTSGTYYSEVRMIGKKCVYPICYTLELVTPTPTPTPTPTVTPTPTLCGQVTTFDVTNNESGNYVINGASNPTIDLLEGQTYTFNISAVGHPFWIKTSPVTGTGSAYNSGVTNNGTENGTITFVVPYDAPSTLYYICQYHSSMQGVIDICDVPTPTPTPTVTPTPTPTDVSTIFTHGAVRAVCSDFCVENYLIQTLDSTTALSFGTLTIGDFIYGYPGQSGFIAYSNVSTDTNTGPFRIAEIEGDGQVIGINECIGLYCVPL